MLISPQWLQAVVKILRKRVMWGEHWGRKGDQHLTEISILDEERGEWQVESDFVAAVRGEREVTHTTFADGVHYMEFTDAVARSIQNGRLEVV